MLVPLVGFAVALVATPVAGALARRLGVLDHPGPFKVQSEPVPYLGGVAAPARRRWRRWAWPWRSAWSTTAGPWRRGCAWGARRSSACWSPSSSPPPAPAPPSASPPPSPSWRW